MHPGRLAASRLANALPWLATMEQLEQVEGWMVLVTHLMGENNTWNVNNVLYFLLLLAEPAAAAAALRY